MSKSISTAFSKAVLLSAFLVLGTSKIYSEILNNDLMLSELVYQIRDPQTKPKVFRKSLKKIGERLTVEALENFKTKEVEIETLTGATASHLLLDDQPVLITILRGGIPLLLGMQEVFPNAPVGFFGMARNEETLEPMTSYIALPDLKDKNVILADTMVATGGSIVDAIKVIEKHGAKKIVVICAIAATDGIARIAEYNPDIKVYAAATDPILNENGYIVPGLGDAGDRCYGKKL